MKRLVLISLITYSFNLFFFSAAHGDGGHPVIGSFRVASDTSTTDEYVEIYNPTLLSINIENWQLAKKTSSGNKYNLVTAFPSAIIKPGESIIVAHKDSTEKADIFYSSTYSISEDNTIILYGDSGKTEIDKVGFGKAIDYEGTVLPPAEKSVWQRTAGIDTENNLRDFQKLNLYVGDYNGICLSEIMPRPQTGADEWIELYNSEMTKDIGGLKISDKSGATKEYVVPLGTKISEGGYLVFYKKTTGITLNDESDGVVLLDATGKIFDDSGNYQSAPPGMSYASDGKKWSFTGNPTPGAANIIDTETVSAINSKKRITNNNKIESSIKGVLPDAEVKGGTDSNQIASSGKKEMSDNDKILGIGLMGVAIASALIYTIAVNKEKIVETYKQERTRYAEIWRKYRKKIKG